MHNFTVKIFYHLFSSWHLHMAANNLVFGQTFHLSNTTKKLLINQVQILYLAFHYCLLTVVFLIVSCVLFFDGCQLWMSQRCGSQQASVQENLFLCFLFVCLFCSMREILWLGCFTATQTWSIKGLFYFQTTMYPSTIFCWNWQYLKPPEMIWEAVDRHNMCVWKGLSHNTSIYPFSEALSSLWSTCLTCFAHNSFIIFVSSIAMVGVDFCLVCLIDKSILKLFFCCCFFFLLASF